MFKLYSGVMIDIDGVILRGGDITVESRGAIERIMAEDVPFVFVTNNVTTPRATLKSLLGSLTGIANPPIVDPVDVFGEMHELRKIQATTWLVIGSDELASRLRSYGLSVVREPSQDGVTGILVSSVVSLDYRTMIEAVRCLASGAEAWATGLDRLFYWRDLPWPGVGALVAFLEYSTGRKFGCLGKPSPEIFFLAQKRLGIEGKILVIGDDLLMDIEGASRAGFDTALVYSGVTSEEMLEGVGFRPSFVADNLSVLVDMMLDG